jgi:hypothetical protein
VPKDNVQLQLLVDALKQGRMQIKSASVTATNAEHQPHLQFQIILFTIAQLRIPRHLQDSSTAHRGHEELPLLSLDLQEKYHPLNNMKLVANPTISITLVKKGTQAILGVISRMPRVCYKAALSFMRNNGKILWQPIISFAVSSWKMLTDQASWI